MFNIISFGKNKENLLLAAEHQVIGSTLSTFSENVKTGALVFLHCSGKIWATAEIVDDYFFSEDLIWKDKIYPHRYKFQNCKLLSQPIEISDGVINAEFRKGFGSAWAYRFLFSPKPIPKNISQLIIDKILNIRLTDYKSFSENLLSK